MVEGTRSNQLLEGLNAYKKSTDAQFQSMEAEMQALRMQVEKLVEAEMQAMRKQLEAMSLQLSSFTMNMQGKGKDQFEDTANN